MSFMQKYLILNKYVNIILNNIISSIYTYLYVIFSIYTFSMFKYTYITNLFYQMSLRVSSL